QSAARFNDTFLAPLNRHRASLGLEPVDDVRDYMFTDRPWLAADPTLGPWPEPGDGAVFQPGAWILADERPLPADLLSFLDAGEPPVYFGLGSSVRRENPSDVMIHAARALGRRAIVSRGWTDLALVDDGADCFAVGDTNLHALFKRVAVIVH